MNLVRPCEVKLQCIPNKTTTRKKRVRQSRNCRPKSWGQAALQPLSNGASPRLMHFGVYRWHLSGVERIQPRRVRSCLCCGAATAAPSIPSCWDHWQLLPEELRSSILKSAARSQLTVYANGLTEAIVIWRNAGAWRPKREAPQPSPAMKPDAPAPRHGNVIPFAAVKRPERAEARDPMRSYPTETRGRELTYRRPPG